MPSPILRALDIPVAFTLLGLAFAFGACLMAFELHMLAALLFVIVAGAVDFFDGWVARRLSPDGKRSPVSRSLDSIVDVCSFGLAPALVGYAFGLSAPWQIAVLGVFLCANALRLAYFAGTPPVVEDGKTYYVGMPVTYVALFLPWVFLLDYVLPRGTFLVVLAAAYALMALAMVSGLKVLKPAGAWYGIYTALGLVPVCVMLVMLSRGATP